MDQQTFIVLILSGSVLAPFITALVNRPQWSRATRQIVALVVSLAIAVVAILGTDGFTGNWYLDLILVLTTATFAYETVWKPTGAAPAVEKATSPKTNAYIP
jgi:hypothetical protein